MSYALAMPVSSVSLRATLESGVARIPLTLEPGACEKLLDYLSLLAKWNLTYNLTAIRDPAKMVSAHLLDSLAVVPYLSGQRVLDVGSGAGLPGIPLAIAWRTAQVTLLESSQKKAAFLRQAIASLRLRNAGVAGERVEHRRSAQEFDLIISRAFASIGEFVRASGRLLAPGGVIAAMKGARPEAELQDIPAGFRVRQVIALSVPTLDAERHLVVLERT